MAERLVDSGPMGKVVKTYLILIAAAARRETVTYGAVGNATEVHNLSVGKRLLDPVWRFCEMKGHPDLTTIVVNADTGEPGEGRANYRERENVYNYSWTDYAPPTIEELEAMPNG
ncbi:MAG: hypothetical protein OXI54_16380 [Chloroflexota bacterium]|nr:hypothetical protein [Chloroflexota bacterium]MDE2685705.1 hypothetical protein [Chloroflexota bacterium]